MAEVKEEKAAEQPKKPQTAAEIELEVKKLELEAKRLEVLEKQANLQDLRERLDERQLKRETSNQRSKVNAATLLQNEMTEKARQTRCTHKKGGNGLQEYQNGRGQSPQYAVIKHTMLNGDMWIRCMRCGKTWKPPIEKTYTVAGTLSTAEYQSAIEEYKKAKEFETNNTPSSSYIFGYSDGGKFSREVLEPTNLR